VAATLIRTAQALRLLGAEAVITGIRPPVARALVTLGVNLAKVVTRGTLEGGIAYALGRNEGVSHGKPPILDPHA
jgi:rsbT co-antagonist protein RsbR